MFAFTILAQHYITRVVEIFRCGKQGPIYLAHSIKWLLMTHKAKCVFL